MANFLDEHGLGVVWERIKELVDKIVLKRLDGKLDKRDSDGVGYINYNSDASVGDYASVFGYHCASTDNYAHSEGYDCASAGQAAHSEGWGSRATASYAHAEGSYSEASKNASHAEGYYTTANSNYQHVQGKFNVIDSNSKYADIIGWGTSTSSSGRKNIEATTITGDKRLKGDVYVHCNNDSTGGVKVMDKEFLAVIGIDGSGTRTISSNSTGAYYSAFTAGTWRTAAVNAEGQGGGCPSWASVPEDAETAAGYVTINKMGYYKVDYQIYFYDGFTANDNLLVCVLKNYKSTSSPGDGYDRTTRARAATATPYQCIGGSAIVWCEPGDVLRLAARNATGGRGTFSLGSATRMIITSYAI